MKMLTIVGARPQFIKAATVSRRLRSLEFSDIEERIVHTGQHYDHSLSAAFFEDLGIPEPFCNLGAGSGSHGAQTGAIMTALEKVISKERPDWILLYGDTNSTLAGAIVAAKADHTPQLGSCNLFLGLEMVFFHHRQNLLRYPQQKGLW